MKNDRDQRSSENALLWALNHLQKNWLYRCALLINKINWLGELEQTMPNCLLGFFPIMEQEDLVLTFTFRLSMVVSSNSSPILKEISEFLKVLSVLMLTFIPASALIMILGFADPARVWTATLTPVGMSEKKTQWIEETTCLLKRFRKKC